MKRISRELWAIIFGIVTAYVLQLVMIALIWLDNTSMQFDTKAFYPMLVIQLPIAPIASWFYMGIIGVNWQKKWNNITKKTGAFVIPFMIISLLMLFIIPTALEFWQFWIADILLSMVAAFTVCRNLLTQQSEKDRRK